LLNAFVYFEIEELHFINTINEELETEHEDKTETTEGRVEDRTNVNVRSDGLKDDAILEDDEEEEEEEEVVKRMPKEGETYMGKYFKAKRERCIAYMESNCSRHFYSSSLFQTCFIVLASFSSILKHPNKSVLTQSIFLFYHYTFFV
jgi:hypothetical protein